MIPQPFVQAPGSILLATDCFLPTPENQPLFHQKELCQVMSCQLCAQLQFTQDDKVGLGQMKKANIFHWSCKQPFVFHDKSKKYVPHSFTIMQNLRPAVITFTADFRAVSSMGSSAYFLFLVPAEQQAPCFQLIHPKCHGAHSEYQVLKVSTSYG